MCHYQMRALRSGGNIAIILRWDSFVATRKLNAVSLYPSLIKDRSLMVTETSLHLSLTLSKKEEFSNFRTVSYGVDEVAR